MFFSSFSSLPFVCLLNHLLMLPITSTHILFLFIYFFSSQTHRLPFLLTFDLLCCIPAPLHPPCLLAPLFIIPLCPTSTPPLTSPHFILPQNHERETALHCAAQYGHSDVVSVLLQELTDPTMRNSQQESPLDLAALYGRLQVSVNDILLY